MNHSNWFNFQTNVMYCGSDFKKKQSLKFNFTSIKLEFKQKWSLNLKERDLKKKTIWKEDNFFSIQSWLLKWFNQPYNMYIVLIDPVGSSDPTIVNFLHVIYIQCTCIYNHSYYYPMLILKKFPLQFCGNRTYN